MKVLFVCTGNICRSPMAEAYFNKLCADAGILDRLSAESAGVFATDGISATRTARMALSDMGTDINNHRSRHITLAMLDEADLIIAMTSAHKDAIAQIYPAATPKTKLLLEYINSPGRDVDDPFGGDIGVYTESFAVMKPALDALFAQLKKQLK